MIGCLVVVCVVLALLAVVLAKTLAISFGWSPRVWSVELAFAFLAKTFGVGSALAIALAFATIAAFSFAFLWDVDWARR